MIKDWFQKLAIFLFTKLLAAMQWVVRWWQKWVG